MEMNYTLRLDDGTEITGLGLNGNNFVSEEQIDESLFDGNLDTLTILKDGEEIQVMNNVEMIQQVQYTDGWYICFRELSQQELKEISMNAKIEYIAMMTDVELYDEEV